MTNEKRTKSKTFWRKVVAVELALGISLLIDTSRTLYLNSKINQGLPSPTQEGLILARQQREIAVERKRLIDYISTEGYFSKSKKTLEIFSTADLEYLSRVEQQRRLNGGQK